MRTLSSDWRGQMGFTLLELLISITLLGLIVLITAGALRAGYRSTEKGQIKIEALERFRTSLNIVESQVQSAFKIKQSGTTLDPDFFQFKGERTIVQFRSIYSLWGGATGPVAVQYEVRDRRQGGKALYVIETPIAIPDAPREVKLFDNMSDIYFEYYYKGPTDEKGSWMEEWTDKDNIPDRIRMTIEKDAKILPMIILVRAGINVQQVTTVLGSK
ncbi:MAG: type II secretion system protein J [Dissulfurispiraceae bacterium]|jgi:general secretion pathway protein J